MFRSWVDPAKPGLAHRCSVGRTGPAARIPASPHKSPTRLLAREAFGARQTEFDSAGPAAGPPERPSCHWSKERDDDARTVDRTPSRHTHEIARRSASPGRHVARKPSRPGDVLTRKGCEHVASRTRVRTSGASGFRDSRWPFGAIQLRGLRLRGECVDTSGALPDVCRHRLGPPGLAAVRSPTRLSAVAIKRCSRRKTEAL
jgi:hypothetical protein